MGSRPRRLTKQAVVAVQIMAILGPLNLRELALQVDRVAVQVALVVVRVEAGLGEPV